MTLNFASLPKFCISLKNSPRRRVVQKEFDKLNMHVTFFDAIDKKTLTVPELSPKLKIESDRGHVDGILACMMSHVALIKKAKELNLPAIVIMEDDVVFSDDFRERISYIESLDLDFDFFSLGGHFQHPIAEYMPNESDARITPHKHIFKVLHQGGTYSYIITEKVYDFVLRNCTYHYGADQFYSDNVYHRFNSYAFVPFLCGSRGGVSEITGSDMVYKNIDWYYSPDKINGLTKETLTPKIITVQRIVPIRQTSAINLLDCTFISAVRIDSKDREFNFLRVIQYLCDNFSTNIIIKESAKYSRIVEILPWIDRKECSIEHIFEQSDDATFHRTRFLNEMLCVVKTPVCINYDVDILMEPKAYVAARDKVIMDGYDLIYPFALGEDIQKQVTVPEHIKNNYKGENLFNPEWQKPWVSYCGHCQFFNTDSYIEGGMENEEFLSYGPEDRERCERFHRLGYKVVWLDAVIYHIEHSRDSNSSVSNPHFHHNEALLNRLREMSVPQLVEYYKNVDYIKKYVD